LSNCQPNVRLSVHAYAIQNIIPVASFFSHHRVHSTPIGENVKRSEKCCFFTTDE
jgi:hypothetical protein